MAGEDLENVKLLEYYGVIDPPEGPGWKTILCPFHEEKRPSARSNGSGFMCNGCGVKGSPISLIMERESIDYQSALKFYEEITGQSIKGLHRSAIRQRKRVDLSGEKRSYERNGGIFSFRAGDSSSSRQRPRFSGR